MSSNSEPGSPPPPLFNIPEAKATTLLYFNTLTFSCNYINYGISHSMLESLCINYISLNNKMN
jgi:hypothetical protein